MKVRITRIDKELPLPEYHTEGAVAFDLYSRMDVDIAPKERAVLPSNFIIEVPKGYFLMIAARSSTAKRGLMLANGVGTIDQDYHGPKDEVGISVYNFTDEPVMVKRGDRIAQGLLIPIIHAEWQEVEKIKDESRGGFGSTG
ncbi:MAG TPA: dUTP diphosphatase [Candidatus Paceibacterota bacterium]|nr:dUTP diphosphatase [Candidatus Paceibacterota bacterium]